MNQLHLHYLRCYADRHRVYPYRCASCASFASSLSRCDAEPRWNYVRSRYRPLWIRSRTTIVETVERTRTHTKIGYCNGQKWNRLPCTMSCHKVRTNANKQHWPVQSNFHHIHQCSILLTKSYRFISKCFFRAPPAPPPLPLPTPPPPLPISFSTSDTSGSRISNSFSPCNFFNTREDIFLHMLVRRFTAHWFYFYWIFFGQFVDVIADARCVVDNGKKWKSISRMSFSFCISLLSRHDKTIKINGSGLSRTCMYSFRIAHTYC